MDLCVVKHKIYDDVGNDNCCGKVLKETSHTYVRGEESEVKALVDDLNKRISTRFPITEEQEISLISAISQYRHEQKIHPELYNELQEKINSLYRNLNDNRYDYWCYELVSFLDVSSTRAFLM